MPVSLVPPLQAVIMHLLTKYFLSLEGSHLLLILSQVVGSLFYHNRTKLLTPCWKSHLRCACPAHALLHPCRPSIFLVWLLHRYDTL